MVQQQTVIDTATKAGDVLALSTVVATIAGLLPAIAAMFSIVWLGAQILMSWDKIKESFNKHIRGK